MQLIDFVLCNWIGKVTFDYGSHLRVRGVFGGY